MALNYYALAPETYALNGQELATRHTLKLLPPNSRIYRYKTGFQFRAFAEYLRCLPLLLWLFQLNKQAVLYIVISRSFLGYLRDLPFLLTSFFGVKIICHVHGSDIINLLNSPFFLFSGYLYSRVSCILVPSSHLMSMSPLRDFSNVFHLDNFLTLDPSALCVPSSSIAYSPFTDNSRCRFLWNSNVIASKGFLELLPAFDHAYACGFKFTFTVLGVPISDHLCSASHLSELLKSYSNQPWFSYVGPQSQSSVSTWVLNSDCICLPSCYPSECQPLAIIEAMAFGKQLLVSKSPALLATINNYPAYISEVNCHSLAITVASVIEDFNSQSFADTKKYANQVINRYSHASYKTKFISKLREFDSK
jgi:glycosyltransferase involved in cell wall biosynthesis